MFASTLLSLPLLQHMCYYAAIYTQPFKHGFEPAAATNLTARSSTTNHNLHRKYWRSLFTFIFQVGRSGGKNRGSVALRRDMESLALVVSPSLVFSSVLTSVLISSKFFSSCCYEPNNARNLPPSSAAYEEQMKGKLFLTAGASVNKKKEIPGG